VLRALPNANTGQVPGAANGGVWGTVGSVPAAPSNVLVRVSGFGQSTVPELNFAQKTHVGPLVGVQPTVLAHRVDTTTGNSGSPILDAATDLVIGLHTNGGCTASAGQNLGTRIDTAALSAALGRAEAARTATYGTSCGGAAARLSASGAPVLGTPFALVATKLPTGQPGTLVFGRSRTRWQGLDLPFDLTPFGMPGCMAWTAFQVAVPLDTAGGTTGLALTAPAGRDLIGVRVFAQYVFGDPGRNAAGLAATNGVEIVLGR